MSNSASSDCIKVTTSFDRWSSSFIIHRDCVINNLMMTDGRNKELFSKSIKTLVIIDYILYIILFFTI